MRINADKLEACAEEMLLAAGETQENAKDIAKILIMNDAREITTHGTYLLNPIFDRVRANQFKLPTTARVVKDEGGAVAVVDGEDGLGPVAAKLAAEVAIEKAKKLGVGAVLIRNTNNVGSLAPFTEMAAKQGMIALFCCNASPAMSPWGGLEPFFGTQPFAMAIYTGQNFVFSADMSTSVVARGKIRKAARDGKSIPDNWAMDPDGKFTTDPIKAIKGTLLPIGGPKGSAIALTIDIMAGMLSGSSYAPNVRPIHSPDGTAGVGGCMIVIDIKHFIGLEEFSKNMNDYIATIKSLRRADGFDEILIPGESKQRKERDSMENGIELDESAVAALDKILEEISSKNRLMV
ncbi:MAG: Ldh family oxidoreductase [Clostridia bacterium]